MANIFNDNTTNNSLILPPTPTFTNITTSGITISTSTPGDLLFINSSKNVTGLAIAPQNFLVQSSGSVPQYTDAININSCVLNTLKINSSTPNALISIDPSNFIDEILPSTPGDVLQVNSSGQFISAPLTFPNPLFLQNLQLNKPAGQLFTDNSGNVFIEKYQNFTVATQTVSANTTLFSHIFNTTNGRKYKYTVNFSQDSGLGNISLTVNGIGVVRTILNSGAGNKNITYIFTAGAGTVNIFLDYFTTTASTFGEILSLLEPLGY